MIKPFVSICRGSFAVTAIFVLLLAQSAQAHEKWFHDATAQPTCWCALGQWRTLITIGIVLVLTLMFWGFWKWRGGRDFLPGPIDLGATSESRQMFYSIVPAILAVHLAIPLVSLGISQKLLSPNNILTGPARFLVGFGEIACALAIFYGAFTRAAAVGLALIWLLTIPLAGWEPAMENLHYLGLAIFFYCCGRGPLSVDRVMFPRLQPPARLARFGIPALRLGAGLALAFVAFTEKLANPGLASAFLLEHPVNFTAALHMPMCDATFALICGGIELLAGLWIALGIFPRTIILVAFIPFNMSLTIFQWPELIGHLPFYGTLGLLALWTANPAEIRLWTKGIAPPSPAD